MAYMSPRDKMLDGQWYDPTDLELAAERQRARRLCKQLNESSDDEHELRERLLRELFDQAGAGLWVEPPFYCDYGSNIRVGQGVFFNFNCVVLDPGQVTIGDHCFFGPGVHLYTVEHPMDSASRREGLERTKPIVIGADVWIGGGVIILPGVTIGPRAVIGAGSVVTRDVPADTVAAGNPCRVIRELVDGK